MRQVAGIRSSFGPDVPKLERHAGRLAGLVEPGPESVDTQRLAAEKKALNIELDGLVRERTASLEEANAILHRLSTTDALTKLYNRRSFDDDLTQLLDKRDAPPKAFSLCILDVDHFKWINDHHGHQAGDEVLKTVALTTRQIAEAQGAKVYRYGGEEFAIILPPEMGADAGLAMIDAIRLAIFEQQIPHQGSHVGFVTASFGLVSYKAGALPATHDADHPCICADKLLYAAKHAGRNRVMHQVIEQTTADAEPQDIIATAATYEPSPI